MCLPSLSLRKPESVNSTDAGPQREASSGAAREAEGVIYRGQGQSLSLGGVPDLRVSGNLPLRDGSPGGRPQGPANLPLHEPWRPQVAVRSIGILTRIAPIPISSLAVVWHLPAQGPLQAPLRELLPQEAAPSASAHRLPTAPGPGAGWRSRVRLRLRLRVQSATDGLLSVLSSKRLLEPGIHSFHLIRRGLARCRALRQALGCHDESDPATALSKLTGELGKQTSDQDGEPRAALGGVQMLWEYRGGLAWGTQEGQRSRCPGRDCAWMEP